MSQSYPPDPSNRRSNPRFDEVIAIVVALATMGTILFWVLSHPNRKLAVTPNQTPPETQTSTTDQTFSQILKSSLPDGVSPLSSPTPQPETTSTTPQPTVNQPWWVALGLIPATKTTPNTPTTTSPPPPAVTPVPPQTTTINPTETLCSAPSQGEKVCSTTPPGRETPASTVPDQSWASPFVAYFMTKNWATGSDQKPFQPDEKITRGEFAAQLQRAFNEQPEQPTIQFKDVPQNFWAKPALKEVTQSGFLVGYPGNVFRPKQEIPRVQVLVALASGLELKPPKNSQQTLKLFKDADQIPEWAVEGVAAATEAGLVVNYPDKNTLHPNQSATYGEVASMIYQGLVYRGKAQPISSDYIVKSSQKK